MTKIKNVVAYPKDTVITDNDFVIGSDGDNTSKTTKNFFFGNIRDYLLEGLAPEVGGTLKITEVNYEGLLTTPEEVINALDPVLNVLQYNVVIVSVNGNKYLFKLQDTVIGFTETDVLSTDFILLSGSTNVGDGINIIKGIDLEGKKEHRSLKAIGTLATVTENAEVIEFSIDEETLNTFIEENQKTYSVENIGDGVSLYKETTVLDDLSTFKFKKIKSSTLEIISEENEVTINTPSSATIPALYVNNLYIPTEAEFLAGNTKGEGTLAKPFTDTVTAYVAGVPTITANTAIQNALDSYVGTGTRLNPEKIGQQVFVQNNSDIGYIFAGDFNYSGLRFKTEVNITGTVAGHALDMDNATYFNATNSSVTIEVVNESVIDFTQTLGFRNSGNTNALNTYATGRIVYLLGNGKIKTSYNGVNILTQYLLSGDGNNNDGNLHFQVKCETQALYQGVYNSKNFNRIDFYNKTTSGEFLGSVDINIKAFHQTGGQIRFLEEGSLYLASETSGRTYGVTFEPTDLGIGNCMFRLNSAKVTGKSQSCFAKLNDESVSFLAFNSPSGSDFSTTTVGTSTVVYGLFANLGETIWDIDFKNNVFSFTGIDFTMVDLTQGNNVSVINFIGNNVVESLVVYDSKQSAKAANLPSNSVFLKRVTKTAGAFVVGQEYRIFTIGTTDYTLIGATANTVGLYFTATGVGSGTGTAYIETRETVI